MEDLALISIIVPVYNSSHTLKKCVDSLLRQTYKNLEILLVDDGSKDDSLRICNELANKYECVRAFYQPNSGVSSARNFGIGLASGEWVCFVDSDDYVDESYLEDFGLDIIKGKNVLYSQGYQNNYDSNEDVSFVCEKAHLYYLPVDGQLLFEGTNFLNQGTVCSKLYNLKVIKESGLLFNIRMRYNEDNCFFWQYLTKVDTIVINSTCGYHYMHADGINHSKSHKDCSEYIYIMSENKRCLEAVYTYYGIKRHFFYSSNYSQYISNVWLHALIAFFLEKDQSKMKYEYLFADKSELALYKPKTMKLFFFKLGLSVIFLLPISVQQFILKFFSNTIYRTGAFFI